MALEFFDKAREVMEKLEQTQGENIHRAALLISEAIRGGGILQAYGADIPMPAPLKYADVPAG